MGKTDMDGTPFPHIFAINLDEMDCVKTDEGHIWGYEIWLVNNEDLNLGCKLLVVFPGFISSEHGHQTKCEYFQVLSGELKLHIWSEVSKMFFRYDLDAGSQHFIPAGVIHKFETGTKQFVLLLEVSTYEDEKTHKRAKSKKVY